MGMHDVETKTTNKYFILYTFQLPCQRENISLQNSAEFIGFAK